MSERRVPRIRFRGFENDWEQRKLSDFAQRESTIQISSPDYPSVEYEDIVAEEGRLNKDIRQKDAKKTGIFFDGTEVLYGKLRPYLHNWLNPDFKGVAVGDWWVLQAIGIDKNFLYRLIQTRQFDEVANQSTGSKMPRADWNLLSNTEFIVPSTLEEQSLIADTFDDVDHLITLHQRKLEKLKMVKKSMLENCFPKNGEKSPRIRFGDFTDDWEQRKVSELTDEFKSGDGIKAEEIEASGTYPVYGGNGLRGFANRYNHDGEYALIGRQGALCGNMNFSVGKAYFTEHAVAVKANENNDTRFIFYLLDRMKLGQYSDQSAQPGLAVSKLVALSTRVPRKEEQKQIAMFFSGIDSLITLHQCKLEKLKDIKKSMLEKMFV